MTDRRGFVLLGVLWTVTALAGMAAIATAAARRGTAASANRIVLLRGSWAADGCVAVALAQAERVLRARGRVEELDPFDLSFSDGARCALESRLDVRPDSAPTLTLLATGGVAGAGPRAHAELVVTPVPERLAVVRRRVW